MVRMALTERMASTERIALMVRRTSCTIIPLESIDAHKLMCGDSVGIYIMVPMVLMAKMEPMAQMARMVLMAQVARLLVTSEYLGKTGILVQCGDNEPVYMERKRWH